MAPIEKSIDAVDARVAQLGRDGRSIDYAAIERQFGELAAAIEAAANLCALEATAIEADRIDVRGEASSRVGKGIGTYYTMTGPVDIERGVYRRVGERNGKTGPSPR